MAQSPTPQESVCGCSRGSCSCNPCNCNPCSCGKSSKQEIRIERAPERAPGS